MPGAKPGQFLAGAAASNITPPLGISINGYFNDRVAKHIHDELHARCLVLDDGKTRLAMVVCDSCMIPRPVVDAARQRILERTGLSGSRVPISATHTHTAPTCASVFQSEPDREYSIFLAGRIADGVERAVNNLAPARIAWGIGRSPNQVFNRRWRMKPGAIPPDPFGGTNDLVKMNPPVESPDLIEPAGPTDPEISILAVQTPEGRPIALLASYSLHYVGTDRDWEISADYYGAFCSRIGRLLGADHQDPPFVALLANGTSGDINNINFRKRRPPQQPYEQVNLVADAVARETHRICQTLQFRDQALLGVAEKEIKVGVLLPDTAEITRAEQILAGAKDQSLRGLEEVYARETILLRCFPKEMPLILQTLELQSLLEPVTAMFNKVSAFLPNIISAAAIAVIGWFIARIAQRIVQSLLASAGLDRLSEKWGLAASLGKQTLSGVLGLVLYFVILVPVLISALSALQLEAITKPASDMLGKIMSALPNIIGASIVVLIAIVIGKIVSGIVTNILAGLGFNNVLVRLGLAKRPPQGHQTPAGVVGMLVMALIVLLASVTAADMLEFQAVGVMIKDFIGFAGHILMGVIIFALGLLLAQIVAKGIATSDSRHARRLALGARVVVLALAGAMALRETGLADDIVNLAFGLTLGAVAVAFALAFGLGGRDLAARTLDEWRSSAKHDSAQK